MALDTREERQSSFGMLFPWTWAGVDPAVTGFPNSSRQASAHSYAGIAADAPAGVGQPIMKRWRPVTWMADNKPLFGRGI
jgi:hypothetical protein